MPSLWKDGASKERMLETSKDQSTDGFIWRSLVEHHQKYATTGFSYGITATRHGILARILYGTATTRASVGTSRECTGSNKLKSHTALSPAVCDKQDEGSNTNCLPSKAIVSKTVGGRPIINIKVGDTEAVSLVDTGSQVSTISESFFNEHLLGNRNIRFQGGNWFPLSAANGLEIPYLGVALVDLEVFGMKIKDL